MLRPTMLKHSLAVALVSLVALAGCASSGGQYSSGPGEIGLNKTTGGTLLGAAGGGLLGAQFGRGSGKLAMTALGAVLGGFAGNQIGASLDRADMAYHQQSQQMAIGAPIGQQIAWNNPQTGHYGAVTPVRDGYAGNGSYCREFQQNIVIGGQPQLAYGTACRQPDGNWHMVQQGG